MNTRAMAFILLLAASCAGPSGSEGNSETGGPSQDEIVAACEAAVQCSHETCAAEHQALSDWWEAKPEPPSESCFKVCYDDCQVLGSECNGYCLPQCQECFDTPDCDGLACMDACYFDEWIPACEATCEADRQSEFDAWIGQQDGLIDALDACEAPCFTPYDPEKSSGDACNTAAPDFDEIECAVISAIAIARGDDSASCAERLAIRLSW